MELVEGEDLAERRSRPQHVPGRVLSVAGRAARSRASPGSARDPQNWYEELKAKVPSR
ncbi:MAG: hypothetical protein ABIS06_12140 [Vicinamibacterales bacterium]